MREGNNTIRSWRPASRDEQWWKHFEKKEIVEGEAGGPLGNIGVQGLAVRMGYRGVGMRFLGSC